VMSTPGSILAGRAMMVITHYKRVPLIGLSCSIAALSVLVWNPATPPRDPGDSRRPRPTSTGFLRRGVHLQDAADNFAVGEHVEIVVIPFPGGA
jgi:hypothetical protein